MGFGELLFDKFPDVCDRTEEGLEALRVQAKFLKKLAKIEEEYGKSLQRLAKETHKEAFPKNAKEKGTNRDALVSYLAELENIGNHHCNASNTLGNVIGEPLSSYIKVKEKQRKGVVAEGQRLTKDLDNAYASLTKLRKAYYKQAESADKAAIAVEQATAQGNPKAEKMRAAAEADAAKADSLDKEFAELVVSTNQIQADFYNTLFPRVLDDLEAFDHERIEQFKSCLDQTVTVYVELTPALSSTADAQRRAVSTIDSASDVSLFTNEAISGASYPGEIQYEPAPFVVARGTTSQVSGRSAAPGSGRNSSSSMSAPSSKRASAAPPPKAKKDITTMSSDELQERISQIDGEIEAAIKTKKGIATLLDCYPDGSDAKRQVESQISDCDTKVRTLHAEKNEIEVAIGLEPSVLDDGGSGGGGGGGGYGGGGGGGGGGGDQTMAEALYAYEAQGEGELSFGEGERMVIHHQDDSGWWEAELVASGARGSVPSNYVQVTS